MKNLLKLALVFVLSIFAFNSCSDANLVVDQVFDGVTNGAVLRTIQIPDAEYAIGSANPTFSVEFEEQDNQDGALLQSVDIFVSYVDQSAGTTTPEVAYMTLDASDFSTDTPFGLPRYTLTVTLAEMLAATGVDEADIFGGDVFPIRLALNLTDGRTFSDYNAGGIITGGFFSSPFLYNVPVVCAIPDDYMIGEYFMERTSTTEDPFFPSFGQAISDQMVTISGTGAAREFDYVYYPTGFALDYKMEFSLSCGSILVFGGWPFGTLGCDGSNSIEQCTATVPSSYALDNDDVIDVDMIDFCNDGGCGTGGYNVSIRLTKQ